MGQTKTKGQHHQDLLSLTEKAALEAFKQERESGSWIVRKGESQASRKRKPNVANPKAIKPEESRPTHGVTEIQQAQRKGQSRRVTVAFAPTHPNTRRRRRLLRIEMAHPTRFERVTLAFGGQTPTNPVVHRRQKLKAWASSWISRDGWDENLEAKRVGSSNAELAHKKVKNALSFNGS